VSGALFSSLYSLGGGRVKWVRHDFTRFQGRKFQGLMASGGLGPRSQPSDPIWDLQAVLASDLKDVKREVHEIQTSMDDAPRAIVPQSLTASCLCLSCAVI
jgi:hypothetical protein